MFFSNRQKVRGQVSLRDGYKLGFMGLAPKRIKKKEKIIKNKKCVPTARYIDSSAKPTPILFFLIFYLFFNFFARKSPR